MKLSTLVPSVAMATAMLTAAFGQAGAQSVPPVQTNTSTEIITGQATPPAPKPAVPTVPSSPSVPAGPAAPAPPPEPDAQPHRSAPRFTIGPDLGFYLPTKNLVKDRFGKTWFSLGVGFGRYETATTKGKVGLNISIFSNKHNSNTAYLIPLGLQYRKGLTQGQSSTPYVGAEGDIVFSDIHSATDGVPWKLRTTYGGSVFGGVDFGTSARLEVQYHGFSDIAGYDFSGTNLVAGFRF